MEDMMPHIIRLCSMSIDDASKDTRISGVSVELLKQMAKQLSIPISQKRMALVTSILQKFADTQKLQELLNAREIEISDDGSENDNIVQNQNGQSTSVTTNNEGGFEDDEDDEEDEGSLVGEADESLYRKDKNTIPRLINILFEHPDAVARSHMLASRIQLQNKETYDKQQIFVSNLWSL